jgi:hypothetical protein
VDWEIAATQHPFASRHGAAFAVFDGKLWGSGGMIPNACLEYVYTGSEQGYDCIRYGNIYYNDLWYTENGSTWAKVLDELPFDAPQSGFSLVAFDDFLYLFSKSNTQPYRTSDGANWELLDKLTWGGGFLFYQERLWKVSNWARFTEDGQAWVNVPEVERVPGPFPQAPRAVAVHNDAIYVFQSQRVWRSTDMIEWTELEGNTDQLDIYSEDDVNLFSFAGRLWLGGRFKFSHSPPDFFESGGLWSSLDGEQWRLVSDSYRLKRTKGVLIPFKDALYTLAGAGEPYSYRSFATCAELFGGAQHSADRSGCGAISLSELLRVVQLFSLGTYTCAPDAEDGYTPIASLNSSAVAGFPDPATLMTEGLKSPKGSEGEGEGEPEPCTRHTADYADPAWHITLPELLRMVQLYNAGAYHPCPDADPATEDGYCIGEA